MGRYSRTRLPTHGNFYVVMTLLIGAAEVIRRRWLTLMTHIPLLLLMGVMITAPANNFERAHVGRLRLYSVRGADVLARVFAERQRQSATLH